jgi:hypothetical protein
VQEVTVEVPRERCWVMEEAVYLPKAGSTVREDDSLVSFHVRDVRECRVESR